MNESLHFYGHILRAVHAELTCQGWSIHLHSSHLRTDWGRTT